MEKYAKAQMEVIEFEAEDVITTSGGCNGVNAGIAAGAAEPITPPVQVIARSSVRIDFRKGQTVSAACPTRFSLPCKGR